MKLWEHSKEIRFFMVRSMDLTSRLEKIFFKKQEIIQYLSKCVCVKKEVNGNAYLA